MGSGGRRDDGRRRDARRGRLADPRRPPAAGGPDRRRLRHVAGDVRRVRDRLGPVVAHHRAGRVVAARRAAGEPRKPRRCDRHSGDHRGGCVRPLQPTGGGGGRPGRPGPRGRRRPGPVPERRALGRRAPGAADGHGRRLPRPVRTCRRFARDLGAARRRGPRRRTVDVGLAELVRRPCADDPAEPGQRRFARAGCLERDPRVDGTPRRRAWSGSAPRAGRADARGDGRCAGAGGGRDRRRRGVGVSATGPPGRAERAARRPGLGRGRDRGHAVTPARRTGRAAPGHRRARGGRGRERNPAGAPPAPSDQPAARPGGNRPDNAPRQRHPAIAGGPTCGAIGRGGA